MHKTLHAPPDQAIINTSYYISTKISYQTSYSLCTQENTIHSKHHAVSMIILISRKFILSTQKAKFPEERPFPELCSRPLCHPSCKTHQINASANIQTQLPIPQRSQTNYDKQQSHCLFISLKNNQSPEYDNQSGIKLLIQFCLCKLYYYPDRN